MIPRKYGVNRVKVTAPDRLRAVADLTPLAMARCARDAYLERQTDGGLPRVARLGRVCTCAYARDA